jgi:LysR family transcriptional regulator, nitrogen assimilation regulatory protein
MALKLADPTLHLRRIEAFLAVMELRNISRAAAQISVAQSVVSRHLGALEAQLGCRLFERTGRGVIPTPAADRLAPPLQAAIAQMQRATQQAVDLGNQPSGVVRVGLVPVAVHALVGPLHVRVSRALPQVQLRFVEGFSAPLEAQITAGQLDLAVINRLSAVRRRTEERLYSLDTHVIGPAGSFSDGQTLTFRQLAEIPLVLTARPSGVRAVLDQLSRKAGVTLHVASESDSPLVTKELVLRGGLFTLAPRAVLQQELDLRLLSSARLVRPAVPRHLSLLASPLGPTSAATRAVARELRAIAVDSGGQNG